MNDKTWNTVFELVSSVLPYQLFSPDLTSTSLQNTLTGKTFSNKNRIQVFSDNIFTSKPADLYSNFIKDLPAKCQPIVANNGE